MSNAETDNYTTTDSSIIGIYEDELEIYSSDEENEEMYQELEEQLYDDIVEEYNNNNEINYDDNYGPLPDGYCIGIYNKVHDNHEITLLLGNYVTACIFFKYDFLIVKRYLINWSVIVPGIDIQNVEIMKTVTIGNDITRVIIKTFWLKIIQRTWKNILKNRALIWKKRGRISSLRHREIYGQWPTSLMSLPCLRGCLFKCTKI